MEITLIISEYSEVCRNLIKEPVLEKIPVKTIQVVDEYTRSLLKKNNITKIPVIFIKTQNSEIQKISNLSNILEFLNNYNLKIISEYKIYNTVYTSNKSINLRNYDIVITQLHNKSSDDKIVRVDIINIEECIYKIYDKLNEFDNKPLILVVCDKNNILVDIVIAIYMYKIEKKHTDEILEYINNKEEIDKISKILFK